MIYSRLVFNISSSSHYFFKEFQRKLKDEKRDKYICILIPDKSNEAMRDFYSSAIINELNAAKRYNTLVGKKKRKAHTFSLPCFLQIKKENLK